MTHQETFLAFRSCVLTDRLMRATGGGPETCARALPALLEAALLDNAVARWSAAQDVGRQFGLPPDALPEIVRAMQSEFNRFRYELTAPPRSLAA